MSYPIDLFWVTRLSGIHRPEKPLPLIGWSAENERNQFFVEASLELRPETGSLDAPIWFVAAPGAVGKSTLAREIAAKTGAIYLDLAVADTVAGYYLSGGLDRNGLSQAWERGETTVLIDALDEARMRVPEASFEDFLHDALEKSKPRALPTIFFGRTGVVEEARLMLALAGVDCPILVIQFFNRQQAIAFVLSALERLTHSRAYTGLAARLSARRRDYELAAEQFVDELVRVTAGDAATFAGYAPVLEAVANVLAGVTNIATLQQESADLQNKVLQDLTTRILEREAEKLRAQVLSIPKEFREQLYCPDEQLERLAARVFGTTAPPLGSQLPAQFAATYEMAFQTLLEQHPFLDGSGRLPSGAVFDAVILAHALTSANPQAKAAAVRRAGHPPLTANPFLIDFYLERATQAEGAEPYVSPEDIVLLYDSMQARAGPGQTVSLSIEADDESEDAEVEVELLQDSAKPDCAADEVSVSLRTTQLGQLHFVRQVRRVSVDAPEMDVVIGAANEIEIITPVSISAARLTFDCPALVVLSSEKRRQDSDATAIFEASELRDSKVQRVPVLRDGAELRVSWPGADQYPWTAFQLGDTAAEEPGLDYALGRLRKIVTAFRSHGRGELARYKHKIESDRMMKGPGDAIRQKLLQDRILSLRENRYYLDADRLGHMAGTNYHDLAVKNFSPAVREYVGKIIGTE